MALQHPVAIITRETQTDVVVKIDRGMQTEFDKSDKKIQTSQKGDKLYAPNKNDTERPRGGQRHSNRVINKNKMVCFYVLQ